MAGSEPVGAGRAAMGASLSESNTAGNYSAAATAFLL